MMKVFHWELRLRSDPVVVESVRGAGQNCAGH